MLAFERLAEQRIRDAMERGVFDRLPGRGRPLALDDDRGVPEELRMAYRVLRNAGLVPEELALRRGIAALEESLAASEDAAERARARRHLALLRTRLEVRGGRSLCSGYDEALLRRFAGD